MKENKFDTVKNGGNKNSIEEDIILLKDFTEGNFKRDKLENYKGSYKMGYFYYKDIQQALEHILSDYKRVLKENEDLKAKLEYKQYGDLDNPEFEKYINDIVETRTKELKEENEKLKYKYAEYVKFSIRKIEEMIEEEGNK